MGEIEAGCPCSEQQNEPELPVGNQADENMKLRSSIQSAKRKAQLALCLAAPASLLAGMWFMVAGLDHADLPPYPAATILCAADGAPLRRLLGPGELDCRPVPLAETGDWIGAALVAAEDRRFWRHPGIDLLAIARALAQDIAAGRIVSGASTISSQVIRLVRPRARTLWTKVCEFGAAVRLEARQSKAEVLEQYLNRAPFGGNLQGVQAASRAYFGKDAADLSLAEAALLAGLPQSPARLRPDRHPARAAHRRAYVLERMAAAGLITAAQQAMANRVPVACRRSAPPFAAAHFCDLVRSERGGALTGGVVRTTLNREMQRLAEDVAARYAADYQPAGAVGIAVVIIEVKSGAVRALVGSPDYGDRRRAGQVNAAAAPRSAGSTLKPFAYALAFDQGWLTPACVLADVPRQFKDYEPLNFNAQFAGLVSAREALIQSLNIPALQVAERAGQPLLHDRLRAAGLRTIGASARTYGLGLVLGNAEVRLLDLANAYAGLARGGVFTPYRLLESDPPVAGVELFSPAACWLVADILGGPERSLDVAGHLADAALPGVAWKTGTSSGQRDAWTIAYNPEYVVGVWVGNPDGRPAPLLIGGKVAAPPAWDIFRSLYPSGTGPWFEPPPEIKTRMVCAASGCPPNEWCPQLVPDYYMQGVSTFQPCPVHRPATASVESDAGLNQPEIVEVWPVAVAAFLQATRSGAGAVAPNPTRKPGLKIVSPAAGSVFRYDPTVNAQSQQLALSVAVADPNATVWWFVDDRLLAAQPAAQTMFWPLQAGRHALACADAAGSGDRIEITVE